MNYNIEYINKNDWPQISKIYYEGIKSGLATFETELPTYEKWDREHIIKCRFKAVKENIILGYAVLNPYSARLAYRGVAEVSIYVANEFQGMGVGSTLIKAIIKRSEQEGFWTLQSNIIAENYSCLILNTRNGFKEVGRRERMGKSNGVWRDVVVMEKRSEIAGIN